MESAAPHGHKRDELIVAIGRDHAQLGAISDAELRIIGNRIAHQNDDDTIALNDIVEEVTGKKLFLDLYDGSVLYAVTALMDAAHPENIEKEVIESLGRIQERIIERINEMRGDRPVRLVTYYAASDMRPLASRLGGEVTIETVRHDVVWSYSEKATTWKIAHDMGFAPPGFIYEKADGPLDEQMSNARIGFPVFAANIGTPMAPKNKKCADERELHEAIADAETFLVTEWIPHDEDKSPNSQVLIGDDGSILYLGELDQILDDETHHAGNVYPSSSSDSARKAIRENTLRLARKMYEDGFRGVAGFDWVIGRDDKVYLAEVNPRYNRSSPLLFSVLGAMNKALLEREHCSTFPELLRKVMKTPEYVPELSHATHGEGYFAMGKYHPETDSVSLEAPQELTDERAFIEHAHASFADPAAEARGFLLLNMPERGIVVPSKSANTVRIQAYGRTHDEAMKELEKGKAAAAACFKPVS